MRSRRVGPSYFPAASGFSRLPSYKQTYPGCALCFHRFTKPFSRNPFLLILMQNARGWGRGTLFIAPLFSTTSALFAHSFALKRNSSRFFSMSCALFAKTWGVVWVCPTKNPDDLKMGLPQKAAPTTKQAEAYSTGLFGLSQRQEILRAFNGFLEAA